MLMGTWIIKLLVKLVTTCMVLVLNRFIRLQF